VGLDVGLGGCDVVSRSVLYRLRPKERVRVSRQRRAAVANRDRITYRCEGGYPSKDGWKKPLSFSRLSTKQLYFWLCCRSRNNEFAAYKQITVDILINREAQEE
jgi:hypothetical protein